MARLPNFEIGGGIVRRQFTAGGETYRTHTSVSAETINSWPAANRIALIDQKFIEVYPRTNHHSPEAPARKLHAGRARVS